MPFHSDSSFNAAWSTTHGAAYDATVTEPGEDPYADPIPVILDFDVDVISEESNLSMKTHIAEVRKSDLASATGLPRGTVLRIDSVDYVVGQLLEQKTYSYKYEVND